MVYLKTPFQRGLKTQSRILLHWYNLRVKGKETAITNDYIPRCLDGFYLKEVKISQFIVFFMKETTLQ